MLTIFCATGCLTTLNKDCPYSSSSFSCVEYVSNHDGDTISFNIKDAHPLFGKKISVRIKGIDAPEIRSKDQCEKSQALVAKRYVAQTLEGASNIVLTNIERGKYFRILADIIVDGRSLGDELISRNLAVSYHGDKRKSWTCSW